MIDRADASAGFVSSSRRHLFKKAVTPFDFDGTTLLGEAIKSCIWVHRRVKSALAEPRTALDGRQSMQGRD
jgi:hypothetical protein